MLKERRQLFACQIQNCIFRDGKEKGIVHSVCTWQEPAAEWTGNPVTPLDACGFSDHNQV